MRRPASAPLFHLGSGLGLAAIASLAACVSPAPDESVGRTHQAIDTNPSLVISQVYGGGNNSGATYRTDFVEVFNRSANPVSLNGLSVQYATSAGSFGLIATLSGSLPAGGHYLISALTGTAPPGIALPTPDVVGAATNLNATTGKIALINGTAALGCGSTSGCSAAQLASIIDAVGYGNSTQPLFEGSTFAPSPSSNAQAAMRAIDGCTDTNQNSSDFSSKPVVPRNTASPLTPCAGNVPPQVSSTNPLNGAANVALNSNIGITFSEAVTAAGSWFSLSCSSSGSISATATGGPVTFTLDPSSDFVPAETCTVTVTASAVTDVESLAMAADYVFSFTTLAPATLTSIHTIQGASHISPLKNSLITTRGIVTAKISNGYYLQEPSPDSDDATSEGIFVFTGSAPPVTVGDDVQVSGTVSEFRPGCSGCAPSSSAYPNLTSTEIATVTSQSVISSGNALPAAVLIGTGGRTPPTGVIEDDANGDVEVVVNTFDPASDGLDFYESLEDMRVQLNSAVAAGPTATFSGGSLELPVLVDSGTAAGLRTARGGVVVTGSDFNPERIHLANDLFAAMPSANVGDTLPGAIVGILSYTFANYKLFYTQALPALAATGVTPETTTLGTRRVFDLDVAAFNVENLDPLDPASKFAQLAGILVNNLKSPDLVALEEIQDNNGATSNGTVDATTTLNQLTTAITSAGGPSYTFRSINPVDGQDGGEPGGNIRVAFLYRTDRGLAFVDRPGAGSTTPNSVVGSGPGTALQYSPGRLDPTNGVFNSSRKPLAGEFTFQGQTFFVIANHFNSKGGDDPLFGRFQPPVLSSETQRVGQANVVKGFVQQLLTADANARVVVLGDLNDFEFSAPLMTLKSAGLSALIETLPPNERYTYVYQGNSQTLDHALLSAAANSHLVGYDVVHVNSEFAVQASDHDPGIARLSFDYTAPVVTGPTSNPVVSGAGPSGATVTYSVTAVDDRDGSLPVVCAPASGSLFPVGVTQVSCSVSDSSGNTSQLSFSVTVQAGGAAVPATPRGLLGALGMALLLVGGLKKRKPAGAL